MKALVLLVVSGVLLVSLPACTKRDAPAASSVPNQPVVPAAVPAADPNAPPPAPAADIGVKDEGGNIPGVEMINTAIGDFFAANGRAPRDINELVVTKYLQKVPPAPPGKKYAIDTARRQVRLDKQ